MQRAGEEGILYLNTEFWKSRETKNKKKKKMAPAF